MAESYRRMTMNDEAAAQYQRIVREFPESEQIKDATKRLIELNSSVPEPDPLALNRARQKEARGGGLFGWLFGGGPNVSTETSAASVQSKSGELVVEQAK
jgi:hypothetical protein